MNRARRSYWDLGFILPHFFCCQSLLRVKPQFPNLRLFCWNRLVSGQWAESRWRRILLDAAGRYPHGAGRRVCMESHGAERGPVRSRLARSCGCRAAKHEIYTVLGTPTAAPPRGSRKDIPIPCAWMKKGTAPSTATDSSSISP